MKDEWDMTDDQLVALQALANIAFGGPETACSLDGLVRSVRDHRESMKMSEKYPDDEALKLVLDGLCDGLEEFGYVRRDIRRGKPCIVFTKEGYRCPRIMVM